MLNLIDEFTMECLAIRPRRRLNANRKAVRLDGLGGGCRSRERAFFSAARRKRVIPIPASPENLAPESG